MDSAIAAFCFGIWCGLTGPLAIHVPVALLIRHTRQASPSREEVVFLRFVRFVMAPLLIVGLFGVAGVFGATRDQANAMALGMFAGLAAYGLALMLYRRFMRQAAPPILSDREVWLNQWEMVRAAGRGTFLTQHLIIGTVLGLLASVLVASVQPHVGAVNVGAVPWVLVVFAFFPTIVGLYARWTWNVSERQFRTLRGTSGT
jgi:hypothetical protein